MMNQTQIDAAQVQEENQKVANREKLELGIILLKKLREAGLVDLTESSEKGSL